MENRGTHHNYGARILHDAQIMIVDDQESDARLLKGILEEAGYTRLVSTTDSRKVLPLTAKSQPDLILLDLMMPNMDGFQVIEQIKPLIPEEDYLPILVLTADISQETKRQALLTGATDFLTKPFDHVEVLLRINNLLQTRFLHLELRQQNRLLEEKVRERTEDLTRMLRQVMEAQETERRRLSMEVHDGPLQSLAVCKMAVDRTIRRHEHGEHELVLNGLRELRSDLTVIIAEVRSVLADLSLDILSNHGLVPALRDYIARFSDLTGIDVKASLDEPASGNLPPQIQSLLYRLAQEALSNVHMHARADKVELSLKIEGDDLLMVITDNGTGFDVDAVSQEHHSGD